MKIKKQNNGLIWVFNESIPEDGWRRADDDKVDPGEVLSELIKLKQQEKKGLAFGVAFSEVQRENSELAQRLLDQIRAKR